ncbi:hypothetical protein TWF694_005843 [Orbilia ellipsospora]|uniref:Uncharacterized protein n=1 Tax=Orbilia ellipsospora TaxID=2528407 RepID=A0AAV9WS66_9PEZI
MKPSSLLVIIGSMLSLASASPVAASATSATETSTRVVVTPLLGPTEAPKTGVLQGPFVEPNRKKWEPPSQSPAKTDKQVFKRTDTACWYGAVFWTSDYWALEAEWWSHTDWLYMEANHHSSWTYGTLKLCANNRYLFDNTHIYLRDLGDAMAVVGNCCTDSTCGGGITSITGDSGLLVDVYSVPNWEDC